MNDDLYQNINDTVIDSVSYDITNMQWLFVDPMFNEPTYEKLLEMDQEHRARQLVDMFNDDAIVQLLYKKFDTTEARSDTIKSIYAFWQTHHAGYTLKPHVDSYPRVFTVVVYFAKDNDTPEAGTAIYNIIDKDNKIYETVGIAPYHRNSGMIICPTSTSWHGVDMLKKDIDRESVVIVFSAEEWNEKQMHYATWKPGVTVDYKKV
jgi:hypothetical protein